MPSNLDRSKADLERLVNRGDELHDLLTECCETEYGRSNKKATQRTIEIVAIDFVSGYQGWYSEALEVVRQLLPARLTEFRYLYGDETMKGQTQYDSIRRWILSPTRGTDRPSSQAERMRTQVEILKSATRRFESTLFDIRQLVQADMFDSEIDAAGELLKRGFTRAAGQLQALCWRSTWARSVTTMAYP